MSRVKRWTIHTTKDGFTEIELSSWKYLYDYVRQEMLIYSHYVWRGQHDSAWNLETSFDRMMRFKPKATMGKAALDHLTSFKLACRGRRGSNPPQIASENDWWALAQHHGMTTPLLDWSESPFVALYFAFDREHAPSSEKRAIWALGGVGLKNKEIRNSHRGDDPPLLEYVRPLQDENARLVSQSGLFTRVPYGDTVETWVKRNYSGGR